MTFSLLPSFSLLYRNSLLLSTLFSDSHANAPPAHLKPQTSFGILLHYNSTFLTPSLVFRYSYLVTPHSFHACSPGMPVLSHSNSVHSPSTHFKKATC